MDSAARVYRIEEDSKPRADRRLVIAERIIGKSDPGIEIPGRGIGCENVGNALKRSKRRIDDGIQLVERHWKIGRAR